MPSRFDPPRAALQYPELPPEMPTSFDVTVSLPSAFLPPSIPGYK
jgi:hypothetical protein